MSLIGQKKSSLYAHTTKTKEAFWMFIKNVEVFKASSAASPQRPHNNVLI